MADVLQVQVQADRTGWTRVDPPVLRGVSGVEHRFSVVVKSALLVSAFEVLEEVGVLEVMSAYIKAIDTKAEVVLVTSSGEVDDGARELAEEYRVKILTPADIEGHFDAGVVSPENTGAELGVTAK